jgi:hypothetical protein
MQIPSGSGGPMNGHEHYQESERILQELDQQQAGEALVPGQQSRADLLALAQVHATLALADYQHTHNTIAAV